MKVVLANLSNEQLVYLRQKWSSEIREIELDTLRATEKLELRLNKKAQTNEELLVLQDKLNKAKEMLTFLSTANAPEELIVNQQAEVDTAQKSFDLQSRGTGILTDEEAMLQQVAIDEMVLRKTYRQDKIGEVDALLNL